MTHQVTCFSDALAAGESWNLTDFESKCKYLLSTVERLDSEPNLPSVINYQLEHAKLLLASTHNLVGPTGETNELYTSGRGVALIIQDDKSSKARQAVVALLSAALLAGNSIIVCSDDNELAGQLAKALVSLPANLIQFVSYDAYHQLLESDVRSVGYVGNESVERSINRQLSKRTGAIVSLVSETDAECRQLVLDTHLVLRFITEKTRTINITAVGGNATLLELGSESH
ncbi:1-pyrroline-5-carboxylate dehydrogenase [Vibrio marisflavi]|uniref:1-pyrroline-5-carboxylate dehydrogenase n=1 Tax=Vibrio marisflavi CECT 7928 TaxID=634439 RepID=A0ABM9A1U7_9VIBR|nr:1-pyrroline-5-carboxylate dehydrogenase [Vibrio marisflavi]CAH0537797.1 hypothetical protein VMF7928_01350 [Vibrio marisflavi CECT 7928]